MGRARQDERAEWECGEDRDEESYELVHGYPLKSMLSLALASALAEQNLSPSSLTLRPVDGARRCADTGNAHLAELVSATVASLIVAVTVVAPPPNELREEDLGDVPVYWRGDPVLIPSSAPAKDFTPTPKRLESWLKRNKAENPARPRKRIACTLHLAGPDGPLSTSRDPVPKTPCQEIATISDLRPCVSSTWR